MPTLLSRLKTATVTFPDPCGWGESFLLLIAWFAIAFPIGSVSGILRWSRPSATWGELIRFGMVAIVVPCFGEELFFRVLLIPRQTENVSTLKRWIFVIVALALFVAWHPLNGWLLKVSARSIFFDPTFLLLAAILGATCTTAYYRTASVWPAVMIHWLTLMVWKIVFGGKLIAIAS